MSPTASGSAATRVNVDPSASDEHLGTYQINAASGALTFVDADTQTPYLLSPEQTVAPGKTLNLLFTATYNASALAISPGAPIQVEALVSTGGGGFAHNIDIDGDGVIESNEAFVETSELALPGSFPAPLAGNGSVTLVDDDLTFTGTVAVGGFSSVNDK